MLNKELLMIQTELPPLPSLRHPRVLRRTQQRDGLHVGIVDENNKVDIEVAKGFINSAFDKSGAVEYLGFKFDKSDGEALINIMEKYKDD